MNVIPRNNDGITAYRLTVKDVPVDGFWSISVYNEEGLFSAQQRKRVHAQQSHHKEKDGSVIVRFGGDEVQIENYLPIMQGWNYMVRLYRPRPEILSGEWAFPTAQPVRREVEFSPAKTA